MALEFSELEHIILKSSVEIKNQELLQQQSHKRYIQQSIDSFLPSMNASLFTQKSRRKADNTFSNFSVDSEWQNGLSIGGRYTLLNNSQGYHQFRATQYNFYQQRRQTQSLIMQKLVAMTKTYLEYSKMTHQIEIIKNLLKLDDKTLKTTQRRFEKGASPQSEVRRAKFRHLDLENELESKLAGQRTQLYQIKKLIGIDQSVNNLIPFQVGQSLALDQYPSPQKNELNSYLAQALQKNDTIQSLAHSVDSASYQKSANKLTLAPRLSLDLNYTYFQEHNVDFWADDKQSSFTSLIKLEIPLFESSQNYTNISLAGLNQQIQKGRLKQSQIELKENLNILLEQIDFYSRKIARDKEQLTLSEKILKASELKYNRGNLALRDLIEDQRFYQRQQIQTLDSSFEYLKYYVEFQSLINSAHTISMHKIIQGNKG